ncbi:GTPase [Nocardioides nitrophenolicus]|uniref:GTPase n=1 Tax=Nocardioides nitrophenolicus TaxID=60489 RepID=UPI00195ACF27|nr:GTPase [Nocardioides nitrophenolicus]MBM7520283.1 energy-coupling factor transporter ATP-binding protein EcfA2 [Nocardioides nitrophenolicus]
MSGGLGAVFRDAPASLVGRQSALERRLDGLRSAVKEARGRLDDGLLDEIEATAARADGRLGLSARHTVVAIAGATGSGKSTTFNALAGVPLSESSAQRPTTAVAKALVWGEPDAEVSDLLAWLGVPPAHQFFRSTLPDAPPRGILPEGLILLDLPDHDSVETAHHREAERVIQLADAMIWVVDPQKYADAAIHQRFLRPLAGHRAVTMVVMNQVDTVAEEDRPGLLRDLRKVLVADGMRDPRVLGISARGGLGVDELRTAVRRRVEDNQHAEERMAADVDAAAATLARAAGDAPRTVPDVWVDDLVRRVAEAGGVPGAAVRVERAERRERAGVRVGPVDGAAVSAAVRAFADQAARDLTDVWGAPVRAAATGRLPLLTERLDAELGAVRPSLGADAGRGTLAGSAGVALLALVGAGVLAGLGRPVLGAVLGALAVLVGAGGWLAARSARRRGALDDGRALAADSEQVIGRVVRAQVVDPVQAELASYHRFRAGLDAATVSRATR